MRILILAAIFSLVTLSQSFAATFDNSQFVELNHGGYHDGYHDGYQDDEHRRQGEHYDGDGCYEDGDGYGHRGDGYGHRGEGRHRGGYRE